MFVDRLTLYVKGGDGGRGCVSFRREKYVPKGGPDGGDGGDGGSVIVRAVAGTDSLAQIVHKKHWRAESGVGGGGNQRAGRNGGDVVIAVPPGTIVRDRDRGHVLRDLTRDGEEMIDLVRKGQGVLNILPLSGVVEEVDASIIALFPEESVAEDPPSAVEAAAEQ